MRVSISRVEIVHFSMTEGESALLMDYLYSHDQNGSNY